MSFEKKNNDVSQDKAVLHKVTFDYEKALSEFGDKELLDNVLNVFFIDGRKRIAAIREAFNCCDNNVIFREAHTICGAALNLCAGGVCGAASELEKIAKTDDLQAKKKALESIVKEMDIMEDYMKKKLN